MTLLIIGLLIFFAVHLVPAIPALRNRLHSKMGEGGYKAVFGIFSFIGLALIVLGMRSAGYVELWSAPYELRAFTSLTMVIALYCFMSFAIQTNLRRFTAHPMSWGVAFWSGGHLVINGDMASVLLFGSFLVYSLFNIYSANLRGAKSSDQKVPIVKDAIALVIGSLVYIGMVLTHEYYSGASLM